MDTPQQHGGRDGWHDISSPSGAGTAVSRSSSAAAAADETTAACDNTDAECSAQMMEPFNNDIAVFLDRTFRMIEAVPNDIVCWSEAGDSFKIKQVRQAECQARKTRDTDALLHSKQHAVASHDVRYTAYIRYIIIQEQQCFASTWMDTCGSAVPLSTSLYVYSYLLVYL